MLYFEMKSEVAAEAQKILSAAGIADGAWWVERSLLLHVLWYSRSLQGFFAEMNNDDPSASICFSDPTLAFECSEPSAPSEPR